MKNSVTTFILFSAILLASAQSWAISARELRQTVREAYKVCGSMDCKRLNLSIEEIPVSQTEELSAPLRKDLNDVAFDLAQVWGDTILESDYEAEEKIEMDRIEVIRIDDQVAGFRITYSAQAFDHANKVPGHIQESGFATADGAQAFVDPKAFAHFIPHAGTLIDP